MQRVVQTRRAVSVKTPLGDDELLLVGFTGREAISQLFKLELDLMAANHTNVPFDRLLGKPMTVELSLPSGGKRFFHGIVSRLAEGTRDEEFTRYWVELVPELWLRTKRVQSRVFQRISVPDILKQVFSGLDVSFSLHGVFQPRDYCVQYHESDFDFASRLMEEEGIYYFFHHSANGHQMVVANTPAGHPEIQDESTLLFEEMSGGNRPEDRITEWERIQEIRSNKMTLWDNCFEMPRQHLEADKLAQGDVSVGDNAHKLRLLADQKLEIFDYPGNYAKRFDGVDIGGAANPAELQRIFEDNQRTTEIRMQQESLPGLTIRGSGTCRHMISGFKFTLEGHHNADGQYVITSVNHTVQLSGNFRSGDSGDASVMTDFTCIPVGVPFRPQRKTARPLIHGTQTALVVGPRGEEIFTDGYGRVKVQFPWDREGKYNADVACWVRVAQIWAGKRWGSSFFPRIGQEVVVAFENGDPDQPIIVGSVYNAEQMPPYLGDGPDSRHQNDRKVSGIKTCSTPGGNGFNELRFNDTKGKEQVFIHAQCQKDERVGGDSLESVGNDRHANIHANRLDHVYANNNLTVDGDQLELILGNEAHTVCTNQDLVVLGNKMETIDGFFGFHCYSHMAETIDSYKDVYVGGEFKQFAKGRFAVETGNSMHLKADGKMVLESTASITLKVGGSFVQITPGGVEIVGSEVKLNCGGSALDGDGCSVGAAADAKEAAPAVPSEADGAVAGLPSAPDAVIAPARRPGKSDPDKKPGKGGTKAHEPPLKLEQPEEPGDVPPVGGA